MLSSNFLGACAAIFTALAALFGLLAWGKSLVDAKAKDAALAQFQRDALTRQTQLETASTNAKIELGRVQTELEEQRQKTEHLKLSRQWRSLPINGPFSKSLAGKPTSTVEIVFIRDDPEAYLFASTIWHELLMAKWDVSMPVVDSIKDAAVPFAMRYGGMLASDEATLIIVTAADEIRSEGCNALREAFKACGMNPFITTPHESARPKPGVIRILVGSRS